MHPVTSLSCTVQKLLIFHSNVERLQTHFNYVEDLIMCKNMDVLAVTEIFLTEDDLDVVVQVSGYKFFRRFSALLNLVHPNLV